MGRKTEISILNVLFCLMVIFIHVTSYPITGLSHQSFAVKILFPVQKLCGVAVYGFVFLSGLKLFLKNDKNIDLKKYYFSRFKRVYIPFLVFTLIYYLYEVHRGYFVFSLKELFVFFLNGNVECHLYFVVIIMQFYLLLPLWRLLLRKRNILPIALCSAIINVIFVYKLPDLLEKAGISGFAYNDRLFTSYLFFWILGCICGKNYERFVAFIKKYVYVFLILFILLFILDTTFSYRTFSGQGFYVTGEFIHLSYCAVAIVFFCYVSEKIKNLKILNSRFLCSIDMASYEIYLVHILFVHIINDLIMKYLNAGILEAYVIRCFSVYTISIATAVFYKYLMTRIKSA